MSTFISGDKINLRGLYREDLEEYRKWLDNSEVTYFMESGAAPTTNKELEAIFEASTDNRNNIVFVVEEKESGRPLGVAGLYLIQWICRRAEFRILLGASDCRGKGYGTEAAQLILDYAFNKLNLEVIYLGVNTENVGAVKSYENAGFQKEGVRRKLVYRNGRYYDCYMMSILKEEFLEKK